MARSKRFSSQRGLRAAEAGRRSRGPRHRARAPGQTGRRGDNLARPGDGRARATRRRGTAGSKRIAQARPQLDRRQHLRLEFGATGGPQSLAPARNRAWIRFVVREAHADARSARPGEKTDGPVVRPGRRGRSERESRSGEMLEFSPAKKTRYSDNQTGRFSPAKKSRYSGDQTGKFSPAKKTRYSDNQTGRFNPAKNTQ